MLDLMNIAQTEASGGDLLSLLGGPPRGSPRDLT